MIRDFIEKKLMEITDFSCGEFKSDDVIEVGESYFGYQIQSDYQNSDYDKNYTVQISIIGYLSRKNSPSENTLAKLDEHALKLIKKLKDLNFKCSYKDVSIENGIKKIQVTGNTLYNEINNKFIF